MRTMVPELLTSLEEYKGIALDTEKLDEMVHRVTGMALLIGVQKKISAPDAFPEHVEPMPFTLFPSPLPADIFKQSRELQKPFQSLIYKVAHDHEFMKQALQDILPVDEFTKELWNIYETVRNEGVVQEVSVMLSRNDFMMEKVTRPDNSEGLVIKQVELNTFSSGAGGVMGAVSNLHRYSLSLAGVQYEDSQLPENRPTEGLAAGLVKAWKLYNKESAVILFIVGTPRPDMPEPNTPDQRWLELDIFRQCSNIRVIYRTFPQLLAQLMLGQHKELLVDGLEVAVAYYRYGYSPSHYPTKKEYELRLTIERSRAIKCPTVAFHLAGCKKIQQVLTKDGVLERFVAEDKMRDSLRATFVGLYSLDSPSSDYIIQQALNSPDRFVLKPQREGGGNNLFGEDLKQFLHKIKDTHEKSAWILMDIIQAVSSRNRLIRRNIGPQVRNVHSELGIYGVLVCTPDQEIDNFECGYLLRTKPEEANEGGLFSGQACLDSPFLID